MLRFERVSSRAGLHSTFRMLIDLAALGACYAVIYVMTYQMGISLGWICVLVSLFAVVQRGSRIAEDVLLVFAALFGFVPNFGWLDLPETLNPVALLLAIWIYICIRFPTRNIRQALRQILSPSAGFAFTYLWWRDLSDGSPTAVLSRLLPIWDMSAHFYFFISNLEHNKFIPVTVTPIDNGLNQWAGAEYPTGIHYVWSRFVTSNLDRFIASPVDSVPIFALSVVLTYAITIAVISFAISRVCKSKDFYPHVAVFSFGISTVAIGLGVMSQAIVSGFVNISVVLAALIIITSLLICPTNSIVKQNLTLGFSVLTVAYNWYPVLLLVAPALLFFLFSQFRQLSKKKIILSLIFWVTIGLGTLSPIIQTLSLGISHLTVDGGVQAIPPSISILIQLMCALFLVFNWGKLNHAHRALLTTPALIYISVFIYFRISENSYSYYFQKINIFIVLVSLASFCISCVISLPFNSSISKIKGSSRLRFQSGLIAVIATMILIYIFGYVGPDTKNFAGDNTLVGLARRQQTISLNSTNALNAKLLSAATEQIIDLPMQQKAWIILALPQRITRVQPGDGSVITLTNVWLHSLSKSQTLTAFETSYVAANLEIRKSLLSDEKIAAEMPKVFQPDSVTVLSTDRVTSLLKKQVFKWNTLTLAN